MSLRELKLRVVLQEQQALDLTLVSHDRLREGEVQLAWSDARALEKELQPHGDSARELMGRLGCVMVDIMCAERRLRTSPQEAAAA